MGHAAVNTRDEGILETVDTAHPPTKAPQKKDRPTFHGPRDFFVLMIPVLLGAAYILATDAATSPFMGFVVGLYFVLGFGGDLFLLNGIKRVEEWEEAHIEKGNPPETKLRQVPN